MSSQVVLIVGKTTNFELHGHIIEEKIDRGEVKPDAMERLVRAHNEHYVTIQNLRNMLSAANLPFEEIKRGMQYPNTQFRAIITVGGDGTLLSCCQNLAESVLVIGLKSASSSVGYLCAYSPTETDKLVNDIVNQSIKTRVASRIRAVVKLGVKEIETVPVLNEFLYTNTNPAATTRYQIKYAEDTDVQRSSGIWFSTATGSTAAIHAAGGEIMDKNRQDYQFVVRELYKLGHTIPKIERGFFTDSDNSPVIESRCERAILAMDGQHASLELAYGDTLHFKKAPPINLAISKDR